MTPVVLTTDPRFIATLKEWLTEAPELSLLYRFRDSAGSKAFEFLSDSVEDVRRFEKLPAGTAVTVFREPQLPLRGLVDEKFIDEVLRMIPDQQEYMLIETTDCAASNASLTCFTAGESHAELLADLEDARGVRVAVGLYPPWLEEPKSVVHAYVPDDDGVVRLGTY